MTLQEWSERFNIPLEPNTIKKAKYQVIPHANTLPSRAVLTLTALEDYAFVSLIGCAAWLAPKENTQ